MYWLLKSLCLPITYVFQVLPALASKVLLGGLGAVPHDPADGPVVDDGLGTLAIRNRLPE